MRDFRQFVVYIFKKPPVFFPLIGLFHIFWLAWTVWDDRLVPFPDLVWIKVAWLVAYTFFWFWACDMKKRGANGYIFLSFINLMLYLAAHNHFISDLYVSSLFIIDILLSLLLLFYTKDMT